MINPTDERSQESRDTRPTLRDPLFTRKEAASLLRISVRTLAAIPESQLPRITTNRRVRFLRSDIEAYVRSQRKTGGDV